MVAGYGENLIDSVWGFEFSIFSKRMGIWNTHHSKCMLLLYIYIGGIHGFT
jgi:hypothetical protein